MDDGPSSAPPQQREPQGLYSRKNLAVVRLKKDLHELSTARMLAPGASTSVEFPEGHRNLLLMRLNVRLASGVYRGGSFWFQVRVGPGGSRCARCVLVSLESDS
jgi:hypothetical protein